MSQAENSRLPLFERLKTGLEEAEEWMKGNAQARVTEYREGERIGPESLTRAELETRQIAQNISLRSEIALP